MLIHLIVSLEASKEPIGCSLSIRTNHQFRRVSPCVYISMRKSITRS